MSIKAFVKRCLMHYFIITTCVTLAMGLLGTALDPHARFGYDSYFSPLIYGLIGIIPSVVTYSRKELTFRQALLRKLLQLILLEGLLLLFIWWAGILPDLTGTLFFALTVFSVYIAVNVISWRLDLREASEINQTLKRWQSKDT